MVRVVGKIRCLCLIDVLLQKYKVKNRQDGRRIIRDMTLKYKQVSK